MPDSTRETKAIGSEIMKASSELARTSRAAPPIAAPKAAKAAPPATIAAPNSGKRPQSMSTNSDRPASISSVTTIDSATPSPTFSTSSAVRPTSPRVSRGKAFSSRSSASEPATSSTVTNIRVTVAATEIANESRLGGEPETTSFWTSIGWAIERQQRVGEVEVLARPAARTGSPGRGRRRTGCPAGSSGRSASRMRWVFLRPRTLKVWPSRLKLPPLSSSVR